MTAARVSDIPLSKPIRIYNEDLTRLVVLAGEIQAKTQQVTKAQDALHSALVNYNHLVERLEFIGELLESPPTEGSTTEDYGFNRGWEAALYVALGCVEDMAQMLGKEELQNWLWEMGDSPAGNWLRSRLQEHQPPQAEGKEREQ